MRYRVLGNHSRTHAGCAAVWQVLVGAITGAGHELVDDDSYDVMVVNGEGSMHHDRPTHHSKMRSLREALDKGRKAYLVNSVWQANSGTYDDVLRALNGIVVRETMSARDLRERHDITASIAIDLSYFAEVPEETHQKLNGAVAVTDFLGDEFGFFVRPTSGPLTRFQYVDMNSMSWPALVHSLSTARVLVTGRHHAVFAACRARIPFVALRGNTHKIEGLVASANVDIPVAATPQSFVAMAAAIPQEVDRRPFDELFEWMDKWTLAQALPFIGSDKA